MFVSDSQWLTVDPPALVHYKYTAMFVLKLTTDQNTPILVSKLI